MKKKYTKKQITEAIAYWKQQLKNFDNAFIILKNGKGFITSDFKTYTTDLDKAEKYLSISDAEVVRDRHIEDEGVDSSDEFVILEIKL